MLCFPCQSIDFGAREKSEPTKSLELEYSRLARHHSIIHSQTEPSAARITKPETFLDQVLLLRGKVAKLDGDVLEAPVKRAAPVLALKSTPIPKPEI